MKVDVLQVDEATFRNRFCWWSNWVDVAVYSHGYNGYLLQMKVSRVNKKKFKVRNYTYLHFSDVKCEVIGDLTQMKAGVEDV